MGFVLTLGRVDPNMYSECLGLNWMLIFKCHRHTIHTYIHLYIYVYITYNAIIIQCYSHVMYVIVEFISVTGIYPQNGFFLLELGSTQPSSWASLSSSETSATPTTVTIFTTSTILVNETGCHVKLVGSATKLTVGSWVWLGRWGSIITSNIDKKFKQQKIFKKN